MYDTSIPITGGAAAPSRASGGVFGPITAGSDGAFTVGGGSTTGSGNSSTGGGVSKFVLIGGLVLVVVAAWWFFFRHSGKRN